MADELKYADTLEVHICPTCFVAYAIPKAMSARKHEDGSNWFCPNGHHVVFSKSLKDKLDEVRRERDRLKQNEAYYEQRAAEQERELKHAKRVATTLKGRVTKITKRVGHGVCPCCNRTFQQLARHMSAKHPDFRTVQESEAA
jgi:hypothetical protein